MIDEQCNKEELISELISLRQENQGLKDSNNRYGNIDEQFKLLTDKVTLDNIMLARSLVERDALMESLRKSEELLNLLSLAAGVGVWSWTPQNSHVIVSANWRSLLGIPEENEVTFETWRDALHPDDREYAVNELNAASEQHREFDVEYRVVSSDGTVRWIVDRGRAFCDEKGRLVSMSGVNVDITERKRSEKSSQLSRLYSVLSKINEAIVRIREPQKLFEETCRVAVEDGQFSLAWIGLADPDTKLIKVLAKHGHDEGYLDNVRISIDKDAEEGQGPTGIALREGLVFVNNDTENNPEMKPWRDEQLKRGFRASASFPFIIENQTIGVITLYAKKTNYFDEEEIQLLQSLADDVSFAIESADIVRQRSQAVEELRSVGDDLEERVRERTANLETMHGITTIATSTLEIVKVSERVLKSLAEIFGLSYASTYIFNDELQELEPIALYGYPNDFFKTILPFKLDSEYESVRVFRSGVPIIVEDIEESSMVESAKEVVDSIISLTGIPFKSYMFLPLVAHKEIIGTMSLTWPTVRKFSQDDIDFFKSIASEITVGLENAQLHKQTEEELARTQLLQDVAVAATTGPDLHAVSNGILQALKEHIHLKTGVIYQLNEEKQVFYALSQLSSNDDLLAKIKEFSLTSEEFIDPKAAQAEKILTHKKDMPSPERVALLKQVGAGDTRVAVIPIKYQDKVTGIISLTFDGRRGFTQAELALFESIAHIASQAIENVRLYEAEKKRAEELAEHRKNLEKTIRKRTKEVRDINARLRQSEAQHRQIIEASPDAYFVFAQNKILYANPAALQLFGYKNTGQIDAFILKNLIMSEKYQDLEPIEGPQKPIHLGEIIITKEDGLPVTVEGLVIPIVFEGENAYQYIIRDITQRKEIEKEMARLERLNLISEMAVSMSSHFEEKLQIATEETRQELVRFKEAFSRAVGLEKIVINSELMKKTFLLAAKMHEDRTVPVLIEGETGTGKEVIAKYIHYGNGNVTTPFIALNCAAIAPSLFESELFGYEAGAFTGGLSKGQKGKLEMANGGTLFLDEISELPIELQAKLLRVLQENEYFRVGGLKVFKTDARIICATNQNIEIMVAEGKFRRDLYYRLNVGRIYLPPLRERVEDILPLAYSYLNEFAEERGSKFRAINKEAGKILESYEWPGNVREIKNAMQKVILLWDDWEVKPQYLNFLNNSNHSVQPESDKSPSTLDLSDIVLPADKLPIEDVYDDIVKKALEFNNGNKTKTAQYLNISRNSLLYRLKQIYQNHN